MVFQYPSNIVPSCPLLGLQSDWYEKINEKDFKVSSTKSFIRKQIFHKDKIRTNETENS